MQGGAGPGHDTENPPLDRTLLGQESRPMSNLARRLPGPEPDAPDATIIVGPWVPVGSPTPDACACGNGTPYGHGAVDGRRPFTCDEVLAIRARVNFTVAYEHRPIARFFAPKPAGWR